MIVVLQAFPNEVTPSICDVERVSYLLCTIIVSIGVDAKAIKC
jgi:hypothetical protein